MCEMVTATYRHEAKGYLDSNDNNNDELTRDQILNTYEPVCDSGYDHRVYEIGTTYYEISDRAEVERGILRGQRCYICDIFFGLEGDHIIPSTKKPAFGCEGIKNSEKPCSFFVCFDCFQVKQKEYFRFSDKANAKSNKRQRRSAK